MTGNYEIDWPKLKETVRTAVHFLDNVIDANDHPLPEINEMTRKTRRLGLGIMGFARMLFALGVPYDSERGLQVAEKVMRYIQEEGWRASEMLAKVRGVYPAWKGSRHETEGRRVRNSYVTCIAPTGTISMIADTSGGCEPEFSLIWYKHVLEGENLPDIVEERRVRVRTQDGNAYIHVGFLDGKAKELFAHPALGRYQGFVALACRLASTILRLGGTMEQVLEQFYKAHREYGDVSTISGPGDTSILILTARPTDLQVTDMSRFQKMKP